MSFSREFPAEASPVRRYRTIFLSDMHLGTRGCQAQLILDFLRHNDADTFYLVGDILDGWRMKASFYWPQAHNDVIQKLLRKVRRGARMVFVPGNHDEFARQFHGLTFGGIEIARNDVYKTAAGKRFLVMHGDEFDVVVRHSKWLAFLGDWAYDFAIFFNTHFNAVRRRLGFPYWSFSAWAKLKVKNAVNFIGAFERELAEEARRRGADGVICGHIHHPTIRDVDGITYVNTGDFVESCSYVVEHDDGALEVLRWPGRVAGVETAAAPELVGIDESGVMRILLATDAWRPQVNGVVRTLENMTQAARALGASFEFLTPEAFPTFPLPTYAEIPVAIPNYRQAARRIADSGADHIHIATEGPIGWTARRYCLERGRLFTTSYHTRFPEYVRARTLIPEDWTYNLLRHFHAPSAAVMAPTPSIRDDLTRRGFAGVRVWTRGVDHQAFRPREGADLGLPRPVFLYVGRIAVEKNLEAMLALDLPGSLALVGDGPARERLERRYPKAHFLGARFGEALAQAYAGADVFVFPSLTDTFGVVMLEALASGLPVAAYPAPGPLDVIGDSGAGVLSEDLRSACLAALDISREAARARALEFSWGESARQFLGHIEERRAALLSRTA